MISKTRKVCQDELTLTPVATTINCRFSLFKKIRRSSHFKCLTTSYSLLLQASLDLGGNSIENVKAIMSASGNWRINEEGKLIVKEVQSKKLCLGGTCVTETESKTLLERGGVTSMDQADQTDETNGTNETNTTTSAMMEELFATSTPVE